MHPWERSARRLAELDAAAAGAGARRWVEKTPIHVRYLEKLFLLRLVLAQSVDTKRRRRISQMHTRTAIYAYTYLRGHPLLLFVAHAYACCL